MIDPVDSLEEAELVFVLERRALVNQNYTTDKVFILFLFHESDRKRHLEDQGVPENVLLGGMDLFGNIEALKKAYNKVKALREKKVTPTVEQKPAVQLPSDLAVTKGTYKVLVIDDTKENLELAQVLLGGKHQVTIAAGFAEGMKALAENQFDVVLSDMHMPDNKHYGSFNMEVAKIGGTNPYGFFVIFEATAKGLPVAIVTDANHHNDWVSAGLDRLHGAKVNDRVVLMFNHIGKRWDKALLALEEIAAFMPII